MSVEVIIAIVVTAVCCLAIFYGSKLLSAGGDVARYRMSREIADRWLKDAAFAKSVDALQQPSKPAEPPKPAKPSVAPLQLLALLQREGQLVDFLMADLGPHSDEQIGIAAREVHRKCQKLVKERLTLEPVLAQEEDATVEVPAGFDASAITVTGNVTGQPPFQGALKHRGWRVVKWDIPKPPEGQDQFVVQPAEVELP